MPGAKGVGSTLPWRGQVSGPGQVAAGGLRGRGGLDRGLWLGPCNHGHDAMINNRPAYRAVDQRPDQTADAPCAAVAHPASAATNGAPGHDDWRVWDNTFASQANLSPRGRAFLDKRRDSASGTGTVHFGSVFCAPHPERYCNAGCSHAIGNKEFTTVSVGFRSWAPLSPSLAVTQTPPGRARFGAPAAAVMA